MVLPTLFLLAAGLLQTNALPQYARQEQQGVQIVIPPEPTDVGTKQIPDAYHPFIAPGPDDLRGPCPGLNTLANHGYLPHNGVASFEQIVMAVEEGFNMEHTLASALAALGMLTRGNAYVDLVSIGLPTDLVPPLPGEIDGPIARGLATHGRFEGDVSMTRQDAAIGDNRNFQPDLYAELLAVVAEFGTDDPVTGPNSIVNEKVMQEFKFNRFVEDQMADPVMEYHIGRFLLSYGEAAFTLNFFANGTTGQLSVDTMTSFFADQTFPPNFFRKSAPGNFSLIGNDAVAILAAHPIAPGANVNGTYVADPIATNRACGLYEDLGGNSIPGVLVNTTGLLKQNVDTLLGAIFTLFEPSGCAFVTPVGEADV